MTQAHGSARGRGRHGPVPRPTGDEAERAGPEWTRHPLLCRKEGGASREAETRARLEDPCVTAHAQAEGASRVTPTHISAAVATGKGQTQEAGAASEALRKRCGVSLGCRAGWGQRGPPPGSLHP